MKLVLVVFAVLVAASVVQADLYMHNPPGSNDRNRERNDNRQNANRLFDSQNNAAGGYPWRGDATLTSPDPITYYKNSVLNVQWTAQHACGPNTNVHCQLIMQYMCLNDNPYLRDGYPEGTITQSDNANTGYLRRQFSGAAGQNADGTERIPDDKGDSFYAGLDPGSIEYGYHETIASYKTCVNTERNMGLYTADQKLQGNDARFTRQNPNGGRRGLECPEERDYYPYWRPTVWHDVAVLVSNTTFCPYYLANTENTATRGYCKCDTTCQNAAPNRKIPITEKGCTAPTVKGTWINVTRAAGAEPTLDCQLHPFSRDNHLGNVQFLNPDGSIAIDPTKSTQPETASYNWRVSSQIPLIENGPTLPPLAPIDNNPNMPVNSTLCILRLRYNMSTSDYPAMDFAVAGVAGVGFDSSKNCPRITQNPSQTSVDDGSGNTVTNDPCVNKLTATSRPLYNRPYVKVFGDLVPALSLAINTHQTGRTFQDRSYVFRVADPVVSGTIFNLNVRGRRGNIVQAYPAVEYDFTPNILKATAGDFVHIQLHGSDFNEAKNANNGEGWQFSDRSNIVEHEDGAVNYPIYQKNGVLFPQTVDETGATVAQRWAFVGQSLGLCAPFKDGDTNEQNSITNCGKLNAAPAKFPTKPSDGLLQLSAGKFLYMSTRNNNFSNRSQKATIDVAGVDGLSAGAVAGIVIGSIAGVGLLVGGVMYYGKKNPNTVAGSFYQNTAGRFMGGTSTGGKSAAPPPPDMEYQRQ